MTRDDLWSSYEAVHQHDPVRFLLVGQRNCGSEVVRKALNVHKNVRCYDELLHESEPKRIALHRGYFGDPEDSGAPDWFVDGVTNPERYLATRVFDHPLHKEVVYGLQISYGDIRRLDLWDYFKERCNAGDFCVVHVLRGPIPCFAAVHAGKGSLLVDGDHDSMDLGEFVREHEADLRKLRGVCSDAFEVEFRELVTNGTVVIEKLFEFLELSRMSTKRAKGALDAGIKAMAKARKSRDISKLSSVAKGSQAWLAEYFERVNLI